MIKKFDEFIKEYTDYRNVTGYGSMGQGDPQNAGPTLNMGPDAAVYQRPAVIGLAGEEIEDPYFGVRRNQKKTRVKKDPRISKLRRKKAKYFKKLNLETQEKLIEQKIDPYGEEIWVDENDITNKENWNDDLVGRRIEYSGRIVYGGTRENEITGLPYHIVENEKGTIIEFIDGDAYEYDPLIKVEFDNPITGLKGSHMGKIKGKQNHVKIFSLYNIKNRFIKDFVKFELI